MSWNLGCSITFFSSLKNYLKLFLHRGSLYKHLNFKTRPEQLPADHTNICDTQRSNRSFSHCGIFADNCPRLRDIWLESTNGYISIYAKLVLLELALYDVPVQSTVSLFWFCITWCVDVCTITLLWIIACSKQTTPFLGFRNHKVTGPENLLRLRCPSAYVSRLFLMNRDS